MEVAVKEEDTYILYTEVSKVVGHFNPPTKF